MPTRNLNGWKRQQPDQRDLRYRSVRSPLVSLPEKVDLRTPITNMPPAEPNLDQGDLGSCGPHTAALLLAYDQLQRGVPNAVLPSRLFIYYTTRQIMGTVDYDSGVDNRSMLKALAKYGWCSEGLAPYQISNFKKKPAQNVYDAAAKLTISQYLAVEQTLEAMKTCLAEGHPIICGFTVYESFMGTVVEKTGKVSLPKKNEKVVGGHDILLVGYDESNGRFMFENSWGEGWGSGGDGTIPFSYVLNPDLAGDFWTILNSAVQPPGPPPPPPPPVDPTRPKFRVTLEINPDTRETVIVPQPTESLGRNVRERLETLRGLSMTDEDAAYARQIIAECTASQ
jgi:C1A family cysteine protease